MSELKRSKVTARPNMVKKTLWNFESHSQTRVPAKAYRLMIVSVAVTIKS